MVCPRCGAELNPKQRYCMKCGALNYEHPDNQKMRNYITEQEFEQANEEYQKAANGPARTIEIAGKVYADVPVADKKTTYVDTRVMVGLLFIFTLCLGTIYYFAFPYSFNMVFGLCFLFFIWVFVILTNISIYMKGGYSAFASFLPFYGQYAYFDIVLGNGWLFLITLIPIVGFVYALYATYKTGKVFGKSGWLTLFFPFIMLPVIDFSDNAIYNFSRKKYKKYMEKGKKRNTKIPAFICSIAIFLLFLGFTQLPISYDVANYFVIKDIGGAVKTVKQDVYDGVYSCGDNDSSSLEGEYYVSVDDLSDIQGYPIPIRSSLNGKKISGYFYIQSSRDRILVSYNLTDGEHVFSSRDNNMSPDEISLPEGAIICRK